MPLRLYLSLDGLLLLHLSFYQLNQQGFRSLGSFIYLSIALVSIVKIYYISSYDVYCKRKKIQKPYENNFFWFKYHLITLFIVMLIIPTSVISIGLFASKFKLWLLLVLPIEFIILSVAVYFYYTKKKKLITFIFSFIWWMINIILCVLYLFNTEKEIIYSIYTILLICLVVLGPIFSLWLFFLRNAIFKMYFHQQYFTISTQNDAIASV